MIIAPKHKCPLLYDTFQERKGLQSQMAALTPKLAKLPTANPPTKKKVPTVAATSTSSTRPLRRWLCSTDGAAIIHMLQQ